MAVAVPAAVCVAVCVAVAVSAALAVEDAVPDAVFEPIITGSVPLGVDELAASFDLARFGRAPARFDEAELARLNGAILHHLPFERVAAQLPEGMGEAEWQAIRPNLATLAEATAWWQVIHGPVEAPLPDADTAAYLAQAAQVAADLDWAAEPWQQLTAALKAATGRKGKELFLPLRLALTGVAHGPEMAALLPLIGREVAVVRLQAVSS